MRETDRENLEKERVNKTERGGEREKDKTKRTIWGGQGLSGGTFCHATPS